ncbi:DUF982 domain-containing protein [Chelatococcus asaccharovorans]|nr:DUF982 domain-containing protein [Chelatococcus asaccharovorans]
MPRLWFDPVDFRVSDTVRRTVTSMEEEARILLDKWPDEVEVAPARVAAMEACQAAINSQAPEDVEAARHIFYNAADLAGMTKSDTHIVAFGAPHEVLFEERKGAGRGRWYGDYFARPCPRLHKTAARLGLELGTCA